MRRLILIIILLLAPGMTMSLTADSLQTRAERTNFAETTRYEEVMAFIDEVQRRSPLVAVEYFGETGEGRRLPLVILSNPPIRQPRDVRGTGKLVVFVMANIHAGEVEGKEAVLHLLRELTAGGPAAGLLDRLIILLAPIYNADGNERIDLKNRPEQNGPVGGVGVRENAQGLDLNRDYMKLETPEATGLVRNVFNRWDPHLTIDLHTTNGSYHGYHLTYAPSLNPNADARLLDYERRTMLPALRQTVRERYGYRTYFYGNFQDENSRPEGAGQGRAWATFSSQPRFGNNYVGLRNRLTILSEAYSYADFKTRVDVTEKFVRSILEYAAGRADEIKAVAAAADADTVRRGASPGAGDALGVSFKLQVSHDGQPTEILVSSVDKEVDPRTGKTRLKMTDKAEPVKMLEYGEFTASRTLPIPAAYVLRPDQKPIVEKLRAHGIAVAQLTAETALPVEAYVIDEVSHAERSFQKHNETRLKVRREARQETFPAGAYIVSMAQPLGRLVFYLLEPESDDGLANWNFFDAALAPQKVFPAYRLTRPVQAPQRSVE